MKKNNNLPDQSQDERLTTQKKEIIAKSQDEYLLPQKNTLILWLIIVLEFCISIAALVFSLSDIDCKFLKFSNNSLKELLGVLISSFAIVITAFLVIMDISASGRNREIERKARKVDSLYDKSQSLLNKSTLKAGEIQSLAKSVSEGCRELESFSIRITNDSLLLILSLYDDAIALAEVAKEKEKRDKIKLEKSRLVYNYPMLDRKQRITFIQELSALGENKDIEKLSIIYNNPKEDDEIKIIVGNVLEVLKKKYATQ